MGNLARVKKDTDVRGNVYQLVAQKQVALGNTKYRLDEICSKRLNLLSSDQVDDIVLGTGLCKSTIINMMDFLPGYTPQYETVHRIMIYLGIQATLEEIKIQKKYQNKPKI